MLRRRAVLTLATAALATAAAAAPSLALAAKAAPKQEVVVADLRLPPLPVERSISDLQKRMTRGEFTSEAVVKAYLARIAAIDRSGPTLRSIIALNPKALEQARALDVERRAGHLRGPLHGIPVLIKDNIETADPIATTAGSLALKDNVTGRDAPLVARLRAAGAVILGKTNLSEWANIRSSHSVSGWSAVGGLVKNPYALDRNACGSSSGSGAAAAASLAAGAVGTETDGSVTCPASVNGLVGLKPTVGLVSRTHVVPISHSQDTPGPMTRTVADAAAMLTAMAGSDPADPATAPADAHKTDYVAALDPKALKGARIGVMRWSKDNRDRRVEALFDQTLADLKAQGAEIVEVDPPGGDDEMDEAELKVLMTELKADMATYLTSTPPQVKTRTLADLIAFNRALADVEMPFFAQEDFEKAEATKGLDDPDYLAARATSLRLAGPEGLGRILDEKKLDAIVSPTRGPAPVTDVAGVSHGGGGGVITGLAAVSGYPHLTVPMGQVMGLPVGLSFVGRPWSEARLLALGYAYEQWIGGRSPPTYAPSVETMPEVAPHVAPQATPQR